MNEPIIPSDDWELLSNSKKSFKMTKRKEKKVIVDLGMDKLEDDPIEESSKSLAELVKEAGKKFGSKDQSENKGTLPKNN